MKNPQSVSLLVYKEGKFTDYLNKNIKEILSKYSNFEYTLID